MQIVSMVDSNHTLSLNKVLSQAFSSEIGLTGESHVLYWDPGSIEGQEEADTEPVQSL